MLSILIPVYNHDITKLVCDLQQQAIRTKVDFEIVVADDCSEESYKKLNRQISKLQNVYYHEMPNNLGRSKIRNKLVELSNNEYMIFMDCDAEVPSDQYINNYLANCSGQVVCGGTSYSKEKPESQYFLRWFYGIKREQKTACERSKNPNSSFTPFNFLIPRNIFKQIKFDESLSRYGHEDTLFGYELKQKNFIIKHIDNPLIHTGLDSNESFIFKTKQSIKNLYIIYTTHDCIGKDIFKDVKILKYYNRLQKFSLTPIISALYKMCHQLLEKNLSGKSPKLLLFDLLKLGYLCTLKK